MINNIGFKSLSKTQKSDIVEIPCLEASQELLNGLVNLTKIDDIKETPLHCETIIDPKLDRKWIINCNNTVDTFDVWLKGYSCMDNKITNNNLYVAAKRDDDDYYKFYFREVYCHPIFSRIIASHDNNPFILILGTTPENIKAYIFDGTHAVEILPKTWYQGPIIHYYGKIKCTNKYAESKVIIKYDYLEETKKWMSFSYV